MNRNLRAGQAGEAGCREAERAGKTGVQDGQSGLGSGQEFYRVVLDDGRVVKPLESRESAATLARCLNRLRMPQEPGAHIERVSSRLVAALMRPSANTVITEVC